MDVLGESTYDSGYPGIFETATTTHPWEVDIEILGLGYTNFTEEDDLPAVMFNNGIVDFHGHEHLWPGLRPVVRRDREPIAAAKVSSPSATTRTPPTSWR